MWPKNGYHALEKIKLKITVALLIFVLSSSNFNGLQFYSPFTPLPNVEIILEGASKLKQLIFTICDQNQCNQEKKIENSMVGFFVNPPEGAEHGLKCIELKIGQRIYFKNFLKAPTLLLGQKKFKIPWWPFL